ncbi:FAD-binding oxidoreductase [Streptomyces sp. NPDC056500]|uniref:FAD-binding oxidoreductase n=1 Tax=Streptomyces sp. NPDC056500 TaxID=3345840 RepID=UPI0036A874AA
MNAPAAGSATGATPVTVLPDDLRYRDLVQGWNARFVGRPEAVRLPDTTEQVVAAVQSAVDQEKRIAVRSGGHCFEDFVANASVQVVIDMSLLTNIYWDPEMKAVAIEAGVQLGTVNRTLFKRWGVALPGGTCPSVGVGGHISGGGWGPLSRLFGSVVDHLHAVETVVVDDSGTARAVVATRDPQDPAHDLWWAHTGAGGGNFGVVTRYWFRSPDTEGDEPAELLPTPPARLLVAQLLWPWAMLDEASFSRLLRNHGEWHERNSGPDSPYAGMYSVIGATPRANGGVVIMSLQMDASLPDAEGLLSAYLAAVREGTDAEPVVLERRELPWLHTTTWPGVSDRADHTKHAKFKSAYLRARLSDEQIGAVYRSLTTPDYANMTAGIMLASYGGAVNTVDPSATAMPQRDSIMRLIFATEWDSPEEDDKHLTWVREFYRDVFAATGGVPAPGGTGDGCHINYADADVANPEWNTSGVPWHSLYFKDNYPRLQAAKARWDPRDVFRHSLSVRLPDQEAGERTEEGAG